MSLASLTTPCLMVYSTSGWSESSVPYVIETRPSYKNKFTCIIYIYVAARNHHTRIAYLLKQALVKGLFHVRMAGVEFTLRDQLVARAIGLVVKIPHQYYRYRGALVNFGETPQQRADLPDLDIHQLVVGVYMRVGHADQVLVILLLVVLVLHSIVPLGFGFLYAR